MNVSEVEVSGAEWSLFLNMRCSLVHLRILTLPSRLEEREVCQRGSRVTRHLRRSEEDLGSEVVFWMDFEWSIELSPHCFDVAHVHNCTPLPIPLRRF